MTKWLIGLMAGLICGAIIVAGLHETLATRNSSGTYSLPNPPVVTGTSISSTWANTTLNDLATEVTNSLDRSGRGAMTGPLRLKAGASAAAPDLGWDVETNSGWYRSALNNFHFAIGGVDQLFLAPGGVGIGGVPDALLSLINSGAGNIVLADLYLPSMADGTFNAVTIGKAGGTGLTGQLTYTKQATVANSNFCLGTWGLPSTACSDGNNIFTAQNLKIGSTGSNISGSFRGTTVLNPGTMTSGTVITTTITTTGAVAGADCSAGVSDPAPSSGIPVACIVRANACEISIKNQMSSSITLGSATFWCRVNNP